MSDGFRRILLVAVRSGEGPLTEHITATQAQPPERVFMPHTCRSQYPSGSAQLSGFTPFGRRTVAPVVRLGSSAPAVSSLLAVFVADDGAQLTTFEK
jgi:hypothetical protein